MNRRELITGAASVAALASVPVFAQNPGYIPNPNFVVREEWYYGHSYILIDKFISTKTQ